LPKFEVLDNIGSQLDIGKQIDVIYLDMSKAFDKISHVRLLHRLRGFGFGGNLLMWFDSYLLKRRQQTTVLGATSTALPVTSGVPQGSILDPQLFLLYTNDLSSSIVNLNAAAFADDTKIFKVINSRTNAMLLQNAIFSTLIPPHPMLVCILTHQNVKPSRKYNKIEFPYQLQDTNFLFLSSIPFLRVLIWLRILSRLSRNYSASISIPTTLSWQALM
jgi:hypothetical protein